MDKIFVGSVAVMALSIVYLALYAYCMVRCKLTRWKSATAEIININVSPELVDGRSLGSDRFGHKIKIEYEYPWEGLKYRSHRITLDDRILIAQNYGALANSLKKSRQQRAALAVYVDPSNPTLAVISITASWGGVALGLLGITASAFLLFVRA